MHPMTAQSIKQPSLYRTEAPATMPDEIDGDEPIGERVGIESKLDQLPGIDLCQDELPGQRRPA